MTKRKSADQTVVIMLPTITSCKQGFAYLGQLYAAGSAPNVARLVLDFRHCGFFDAHMAAALSAVLSRLRKDGVSIQFERISRAISAILSKNHFLCDYGFPRVWDANQTTLPYREFCLQDSHLFVEYLDHHLEGKGVPKMTPGLTKRFRQSIFEIFANCAMHSSSDSGVFVCGQFFPRKHRLDLTISDAGVGIRTNVRKIIPKISSIDAIRWALQEGNTTKTGSQPGGFGLKLLHEFIGLNRGKVQIASRLGYYELSDGSETFERLEVDIPGTSINFEINTDDTRTYALASELSSKDIF